MLRVMVKNYIGNRRRNGLKNKEKYIIEVRYFHTRMDCLGDRYMMERLG